MKFSVLMSIYFKEDPVHFRHSMNNLVNQSLLPDEIVLVEDGELTKELYLVIDEFKNKYSNLLNVVKISENVGLGDALNRGLKECKNNWIARMDSDDISSINRFELQFSYLEKNPDLVAISSWIEEFNIIPGDLKRIRKVPLTYEKIKSTAKFRNPFNHMCVVFRKDIINKVGGYKKFYLLEDYYLWFRLLNNGYKIGNIKDICVYARVGNNMVGRRYGYNYFLSEKKLFKEFYELKFISYSNYIFNIFIRYILRTINRNFLSSFYRFILRK